jgi:hypothetical protein
MKRYGKFIEEDEYSESQDNEKHVVRSRDLEPVTLNDVDTTGGMNKKNDARYREMLEENDEDSIVIKDKDQIITGRIDKSISKFNI